MNAVDSMNNTDFSQTSAAQSSSNGRAALEDERRRAREETLSWISHSALAKFQRNWRH